MQLKYFLAASAASLSLASGLAAPVHAQETSSSVRGTVTSDSGPVGGAEVTVVHEPTGTTLSTTTDAGGNFSASGLRIGGPVTVTVTADGYESSLVNGLFLQAGDVTRLPIQLQTQNQIVVSASSLGPAISTSDGPTTSLGTAEIENAASINRDIRDLARRDPLVTIDLTNGRTIEIAGNNGRLNRFSVDGIQLSDDFGLNNGGLPTSRGPVPYDAIEQFTVKTAPYDIAEGDLQGGAVNVVLKSGGNRFHGGAFYSYTDDSLTGNQSKAAKVALDFSSRQYGGWVSGPIVKDRLFVMLAYERTKEGQPLDAGFGPGFATQVPGLTQGVIDQVSAVAMSRYAYDTQGLIATTNEKDEKFVGKIDWNITDNQRAALTYIRNIGTNQFQQNTFVTSPFALGFQSNGYELAEEINSGAFELNSTWSDAFSTTFRASYRDYNRDQTPFGGRNFPQFGVCTDATSTVITSAGTGVTTCTGTRLFFGPDISRQSNDLNTDNLSIDFTAKLDLGAGTLRFIAGYTKVDTFNLFLQNSLGNFYFDSLADFQNGRANQLVFATAVPSADPNDAAARFNTTGWTVGLQEDWDVTDTFQISVGLRYDLFDNSEAPPLNANFLARTGFPNRSTFRGRGAPQPRAAFKWEASDRLIVRGGAGIFAGGTPDVFLSNVFSNTGQRTNSVTITRNTSAAGCNANLATVCAALNNVTSGTIPAAVVAFATTNTATLTNAPTDAIDPDLKLARKFKANLGVDYNAKLGPLGDDWLFGVQFLYDRTLQGYLWKDLRSVVVGTLPDGRPRYGTITPTAANNRDLLLTNTTDGRGYFGTFRFEKSWNFGLGIEGSYTRSDVKDRAALTSSTSASNYANNAFIDPNIAAYGRSIYEYTNQYKFGVNYRHEFIEGARTSFGLFGEYRTGRPFSVTMLDNSGNRGAVFGTVGNLGNQLLYVPTVGSDPRVVFDTPASQATFDALVGTLGIGKYRGRIVPKNSQSSPNFFKIDLHFGQEIPLPGVFGGEPRFELFADVENVLNLLNKDWGSLRQVQFPYNAAIVRVACAVTSGSSCSQYRYSNVLAPNEVLQVRQSLYQVRVGARFKF